jgi:hypothetical protein
VVKWIPPEDLIGAHSRDDSSRPSRSRGGKADEVVGVSKLHVGALVYKISAVRKEPSGVVNNLVTEAGRDAHRGGRADEASSCACHTSDPESPIERASTRAIPLPHLQMQSPTSEGGSGGES